MSTNDNSDLLHGDKNPLDLKQPALPNNALPNAGFWNAPSPDHKPQPFADPSKGAWPFAPEPSNQPALADLTEGFNPPSEAPSGGLVLPESAPLHPAENKAIHADRIFQGVPLPHQRANREAAKRQRGET